MARLLTAGAARSKHHGANSASANSTPLRALTLATARRRAACAPTITVSAPADDRSPDYEGTSHDRPPDHTRRTARDAGRPGAPADGPVLTSSPPLEAHDDRPGPEVRANDRADVGRDGLFRGKDGL